MEALLQSDFVASIKPALLVLVYTFAATFAAGLVGRLLAGLVEKLAELKTRVNTTKYGALTQLDDYLFDALTNAVIAVQATVVDRLKADAADGKLTKEEMVAARDLAYETFMAALPIDVRSELLRVAGADVKAFVMARIPAVVEAIKGLPKSSTPLKLDDLGARVDETVAGLSSDPQ